MYYAHLHSIFCIIGTPVYYDTDESFDKCIYVFFLVGINASIENIKLFYNNFLHELAVFPLFNLSQHSIW